MEQDNQLERRDDYYYDEYEIDLREYIMLLWEKKWFIGGLFVVAVIAAGLFTSFFMQPVYQTEVTIQLSNSDGLYSNPQSAIQLLKSAEIVQPVMNELGEEFTAAELNGYLKNNISINQIGDTNILNMQVKYNDPLLVKKIASGIVSTFGKKSETYFNNKMEIKKDYLQQLNQELVNLEKQINEHEANLVSAGQAENLSSLRETKRELLTTRQEVRTELNDFYPLVVLNNPYLPENPVEPNLKLNVAIAGILALMLAVFIVFFKEFMEEEDAE